MTPSPSPRWRACRGANRDTPVERLVLERRQARAVATRHDKLEDVFTNTVQLAQAFIKARSVVHRG